VQNASAKLNRLYAAGYIQREMVAAESGGIEFVYMSVDHDHD
jgi:predicted transcriptional regulator